MSQVVFLLEEPSMALLLHQLLPRLFPGLKFLLIKHEGKADLDRSIPRKLRAWQDRDVRFVIVRDSDGADCRVVKARLLALSAAAGRTDVLVRIVCQELEAWHLGDLSALGEAYGTRIAASQEASKYRDPDRLGSPSSEVKRLIPVFQKAEGARRMGLRLDPANNRSTSFRQFCTGVAKFSQTAADSAPGHG